MIPEEEAGRKVQQPSNWGVGAIGWGAGFGWRGRGPTVALQSRIFAVRRSLRTSLFSNYLKAVRLRALLGHFSNLSAYMTHFRLKRGPSPHSHPQPISSFQAQREDLGKGKRIEINKTNIAEDLACVSWVQPQVEGSR